MADGLEEPLWEVLADSWETIDLGDFGSLAEAVNALQDTLKSYLIGDPVKFAGSALGLVDLSLLEAIAERVPIPGLDRSLGEIRHYAEIAGIVLVVLAGGHILACASFKLWVHDELGQLLAKLIKTVLRELGAKPVQRPSPAEAEDDWPPPDRPDQTPPHSGPDPNPQTTIMMTRTRIRQFRATPSLFRRLSSPKLLISRSRAARNSTAIPPNGRGSPHAACHG